MAKLQIHSTNCPGIFLTHKGVEYPQWDSLFFVHNSKAMVRINFTDCAIFQSYPLDFQSRFDNNKIILTDFWNGQIFANSISFISIECGPYFYEEEVQPSIHKDHYTFIGSDFVVELEKGYVYYILYIQARHLPCIASCEWLLPHQTNFKVTEKCDICRDKIIQPGQRIYKWYEPRENIVLSDFEGSTSIKIIGQNCDNVSYLIPLYEWHTNQSYVYTLWHVSVDNTLDFYSKFYHSLDVAQIDINNDTSSCFLWFHMTKPISMSCFPKSYNLYNIFQELPWKKENSVPIGWMKPHHRHGFSYLSKRNHTYDVTLNGDENILTDHFNTHRACYLDGLCENLTFTWEEAQQYCIDLNSHLLSIHSQLELDFIVKAISDASYGHPVSIIYIGLNREVICI